MSKSENLELFLKHSLQEAALEDQIRKLSEELQNVKSEKMAYYQAYTQKEDDTFRGDF
jgi:hypothetical protein